jgi:hypothetical protein
LVRSVSSVKVALSIVSLVSQLVSFRMGFKGMILKGFGFVAFFGGVKASSFCIHLSCLVCSLSVVRGEWSRLFCSHEGRNLPEVSIASFLLPQFFVSVRLSKSNFLTQPLFFKKIIFHQLYIYIFLIYDDLRFMYISCLRGPFQLTLMSFEFLQC